MKMLLQVCLLCLAAITAVAGEEHVFGWSLDGRWTVKALPMDTTWVVHRSMPAWQSDDPSLAVTDTKGRLVHRALDGRDVRAVGVDGNRVFAVVGTDSTVVLFRLNAALTITDSVLIPGLVGDDLRGTIQVSCSNPSRYVFVLCNGALFTSDLRSRPLSISLLENRVFGFCLGTGEWAAAFVHDVGGMAYASLVDTTLQRRVAPSVPLATTARLGLTSNRLFVLSPVEEQLATQVSVVNPATGQVTTNTLHIPYELVTWVHADTAARLGAVTTEHGRYVFVMSTPESLTSDVAGGVEIPAEVGTPQRAWSIADTVILWCANGIVTIVQGAVVASDVLPIHMSGYSDLVATNSRLIVYGSEGTVVLQRQWHPWWWLWWLVTIVGPYAVPGVMLTVIVWLLYRLRRQRRFLDAMLEVPGAGLVFVLDSAGRLLRTNERSAQLLRITAKVPMHRLYRAYLRHRGVEELQQFFSKALEVRRPHTEKVSINDDDDQRDYMMTAQPLWGTVGSLRAVVVTGIDITEALEKRRLVNWAQLAHDMQTNLSTVRLNAEQLSMNMEERDKERVRRILFQTDVLIQRVRDLVSVGRTEDLQRSAIHSAEFCTQIRHEFDPAMFPHVNFVMKLKGTMMNVDRLKLSRAVRNAVENAIKSLRGNEGTVEISTWFDRTSVYIRISDTGVGMDTLTLENMMKPYFTTAKDGTGTGIGTMIMQHVVHLHGGSLRVTSEPGEGTQVVFRIPNE